MTLSPDALKLTRKGKRLGLELKWADITSGESALAVALRASVGRFDDRSMRSALSRRVSREHHAITVPKAPRARTSK